jgi:hypothetical protein
MYIVWKKYQVFSKAAEKFLEKIEASLRLALSAKKELRTNN